MTPTRVGLAGAEYEVWRDAGGVAREVYRIIRVADDDEFVRLLWADHADRRYCKGRRGRTVERVIATARAASAA